MATEAGDIENSSTVSPTPIGGESNGFLQIRSNAEILDCEEKEENIEEVENTGRNEVALIQKEDTNSNPSDPNGENSSGKEVDAVKEISSSELNPHDSLTKRDVGTASGPPSPINNDGHSLADQTDNNTQKDQQVITSDKKDQELIQKHEELEEGGNRIQNDDDLEAVQPPGEGERSENETSEESRPLEGEEGKEPVESSKEDEDMISSSDSKHSLEQKTVTGEEGGGLSSEQLSETVGPPESEEHSKEQNSSDQNDSSVSGDETPTEESSPAQSLEVPPPPKVTTYAVDYLGSTIIVSPEMPTKEERYSQTEQVIESIKQPEGEPQPKVPVSLEVSIDGIRIVHMDTGDELMNHPLVTIGFVADCKNLLIILMRRILTGTPTDITPPTQIGEPKLVKMRCHLLQTAEANKISGYIGELFHEAYRNYLRAHNLTEPPTEIDDYDKILRAQEQVSSEIECLKDTQKTKEIVFPKKKNEPLGVMLIESGFGSPIPSCVIAAMSKNGSAQRSGLLNVGDHIISLNGVNFVGLPVKTCIWHVKRAKLLGLVKMVVAHCPPVMELKLYRPDVKYSLGFCVRNGMVNSLYRGTIADRSGIRVGHQIIELNGCSVVNVPHDNVVRMLQTTIGHIQIKTMPYQIYRLMTGQATPKYS
jgi:hypothetical protein